MFYWSIGFLNLHFCATLDLWLGNRVSNKFHLWAQKQYDLTDQECVAIIDIANSYDLNQVEPKTLVLAFKGAAKLPTFEGIPDITDHANTVLYKVVKVNTK